MGVRFFFNLLVAGGRFFVSAVKHLFLIKQSGYDLVISMLKYDYFYHLLGSIQTRTLKSSRRKGGVFGKESLKIQKSTQSVIKSITHHHQPSKHSFDH
jgi:hypothetical protein